MDNKDEVKKIIGESPLIISDWITFLSSEKNTLWGGMSSFIAVLVALIALLLATTNDNTWQYVGNGICAFVLVAFVFLHTFRPLQKRAKHAEELLDRIMAGEVTSEETIRKEWVDGIK